MTSVISARRALTGLSWAMPIYRILRGNRYLGGSTEVSPRLAPRPNKSVARDEISEFRRFFVRHRGPRAGRSSKVCTLIFQAKLDKLPRTPLTRDVTRNITNDMQICVCVCIFILCKSITRPKVALCKRVTRRSYIHVNSVSNYSKLYVK